MIPQLLTLRNFLSYREDVPTLDFAGIHVACLCGSNGHGKSALLDAITWCLWGEARGKSQDDLISYGAEECRVELDFLARDTRYRVIRSRSRGGARRRQGVTDLQLQVLGADSPQPITGNSVRETEAKIVQAVGMDYDTFINSAFLLQGRAGEFTGKTPAERKAVLARIMDLEAYDRLQTRARERLSGAQTAAAEVEGALARMREDLERAGDPSGQLAEVQAARAQLDIQLVEQRHTVEGLRARVEELLRQQDALTSLEDQIRNSQKDISELESALAAADTRVTQFRSLIDDAEHVRDGANRLDAARENYQSLEKARAEFDRLREERESIIRAIDAARSRLEAQAEQIQRRAKTELQPKAQAEPALILELDKVRTHIEELKGEEVEIAAERQDLTAVSTAIGEAGSMAERYKTEGLELRAKLDLLNNSNGDGAVCPLCQTPLRADSGQRLVEVYEADIREKRDLYRRNQDRLQELQTRQSGMEKGLEQREKSLAADQREWQGRLPRLEHQIQESQKAQQELEAANIESARISDSLASNDFASQEFAALEAIDLKIRDLGYDEEVRRCSYEEMQSLQHFQRLLDQLTHAEESLPVELDSLQRTSDMLERRREDLDRLGQQRASIVESVQVLPVWQEQLKSGETALRQIEGRVQDAAARQGHLEGEVRRIEALRRDIAASSAKLSDLEEQQSVYRELVGAFGRQGIQAMLIETVLPRLEEETNNLLGRMTDNRMQVQLETQRERRSGRGDPIETLQINVSDELGPRGYEMYSGGEAFRVNLALRIGLSKVLAQRVGAPLPTLFIDEGFGSQDAAGRERILDVIAAIEDDFDKIIVITHLEDLKDAFQVRIEVQKGEYGSTFWIS